MTLSRILETEVMDSEEEARDYDAMDHSEVNRVFVADFLVHFTGPGCILDVGTGTAQIPIELCRQRIGFEVVGIDLARHMLALGQDNIRRENLERRIRLEWVDAKQMPYPDATFAAVISNSIVHHIPSPEIVMREMVRVTGRGGLLFVRDLLRPDDPGQLGRLVDLYAAGANAHQRQMFADSLHAALTLDEVRAMVMNLGFAAETVQQTTDRHWTWVAVR